jgi:hypothetical protein
MEHLCTRPRANVSQFCEALLHARNVIAKKVRGLAAISTQWMAELDVTDFQKALIQMR